MRYHKISLKPEMAFRLIFLYLFFLYLFNKELLRNTFKSIFIILNILTNKFYTTNTLN